MKRSMRVAVYLGSGGGCWSSGGGGSRGSPANRRGHHRRKNLVSSGTEVLVVSVGVAVPKIGTTRGQFHPGAPFRGLSFGPNPRPLERFLGFSIVRPLALPLRLRGVRMVLLRRQSVFLFQRHAQLVHFRRLQPQRFVPLRVFVFVRLSRNGLGVFEMSPDLFQFLQFLLQLVDLVVDHVARLAPTLAVLVDHRRAVNPAQVDDDASGATFGDGVRGQVGLDQGGVGVLQVGQFALDVFHGGLHMIEGVAF
jgi:hypothetical protein